MKLGGKKKSTPDDGDDGGYPMPDLPDSLDADERGWLMRSPITLWLAVIIVLAAVVGAVVVLAFGGGDDDDTASGPATSAPPASATLTPSGEDTADQFRAPTVDFNNRRVDVPVNPYGQPLEQTDRSSSSASFEPNDPLPAPAGMKWENFFGLVLPYSTSDGPTSVSGPIVSGFAHTPQGAALAGQHLFARQAQGSQAARHAVAVRQTVATDEPTRQRYIATIDVAEPPITSPNLFLRPDAFRVTSYAPDFAVVQYAVPVGFGGQDAVSTWAVAQQQLVWSDGQWKIKVGDPDPKLPQTNSLLGWTTW